MEDKLRMILSQLLLPEHVTLHSYILKLFHIEQQICLLQSLHSTLIGYERCYSKGGEANFRLSWNFIPTHYSTEIS